MKREFAGRWPNRPVIPPETKFVYSDINFVLLGEIVHRLERASRKRVREANPVRAAGHERNHLSAEP